MGAAETIFALPVVADDAQLVARVRAGDVEAFSGLVRRHQLDLYRYARGMGLDHDAAQDGVQEALVTAYQRLDQCREPDRFRMWLLRILRNRCLDQRKSERRHAARVEIVGRETDPAVQTHDELRQTLGHALGALPDALREAFLLKHDQGYAYEEIADLTGASVSAVKMRVHRAREQLRSLLDEAVEAM